jgi:hypothetical protein
MPAKRRMDCECISRMVLFMPGFEGVEVRDLESGSIEVAGRNKKYGHWN